MSRIRHGARGIGLTRTAAAIMRWMWGRVDSTGRLFRVLQAGALSDPVNKVATK